MYKRQGQFTWRADKSVLITVIKTAARETTVYVHDLDQAFIANEKGSLPHNCPTGTVLLGQMVVDFADGCYAARIMFFDVVSYGADDLRAMLPAARHSILRSDVAPLFQNSTDMSVQWVGFRSAAEDFCDQSVRRSLPHDVECVFLMPDDAPPGCMVPVRFFKQSPGP